MLQPAIAKKMGVNQSTVSRYASEFAELADDLGLIKAAEEFGIVNEVNQLRSLAVESHSVSENIELTGILKSKLHPGHAKKIGKVIPIMKKPIQ